MIRRQVTDERRVPAAEDVGSPLAEFDWSDSIIGIGFHPDELGLPDGWTRSVHAGGDQPNANA